jgi:hypothetical protein
MGSRNSPLYIPLPLPKTSKKRWLMYLNIDGVIEMVLYDGKTCFTPEFPGVPIERIDLRDGRYITQKILYRICRKNMKSMVVEYNKEYKVWEAVPIIHELFFPL